MNYQILVINPGSTSTKVALFIGEENVFQKKIFHTNTELKMFSRTIEHFEYKKNLIINELEKEKINFAELNCIIGRGGVVRPLESGIYEVNEKLKSDLVSCKYGEHASNLGGLIALALLEKAKNARAFIADPPVVDELIDIARVTGIPELERKSMFHALNHKAIARKYSKDIKKEYVSLNLIVAHLGGGISIAAHEKGRVVDVNQALDGEGPMSPERAGSLPAGNLMRLCFSGKYSQQELQKMLVGKGGLAAHLNTNDARDLEKFVASGDKKAIFIENAMVFQIAKQIGAMATVLYGNVDAVIITGGIAYYDAFVDKIIERINFIAPIHVYPGEDEMWALANNALMLLKGEMQVKKY